MADEVNRRNFLKTAALAAGPAVISGRAANDKINIGFKLGALNLGGKYDGKSGRSVLLLSSSFPSLCCWSASSSSTIRGGGRIASRGRSTRC